MKIVYFGTPHFAAEILSYLVTKGIQVAAVVTKPDKAKGRSGMPQSSPVKATAQKLLPTVPIYQPVKTSNTDFVSLIQSHQADLFVVVAFGEIIKQNLLDMPRLGCINVHASLLPKYRGAAPIQQSLIHGEKETGITIMHMALKLDAGDIIKKEKISIDDNMNAEELTNKLCEIAKDCLLEVLHDLEQGHQVRIAQDEKEVTYAPKLELEDSEIHWNQPALVIHNLIRGSTPSPGAWCWVIVRGEKKRLKIIRADIKKDLSGPPGTILLFDKAGIIIGCQQDALRITELQLEGKKAMNAATFVQGIPKELIVFILG